MSREKKDAELPTELESQFILRLPEEPAKALRDALQTEENLKNRLTIQLEDDMRHGEVRFDHWLMDAKIVDLPTITESLKTNDNKNFYKTADISQMMICKTEQDPTAVEEESLVKKKKDPPKEDKKKLWPHGLTPPTKNVRKRRFRKTLKKKYAEVTEVEKELKRLLRADNEAVSVSWEIISEDEILKQETITQTQTLNSEEKKNNLATKKESSNTTASASNVQDIFGEAVSDSDTDDNNFIEVEDNELLPQDFVIPILIPGNKKEKKEKNKSDDKEHRPKKNKDKKKNKKKRKNKDETFSDMSCLSEQASEDEYDYLDHDPSYDNMSVRIQRIRSELEELKFRKHVVLENILSFPNASVKDRYQGYIVKLNQEVMYKEMQYLSMLSLQNSNKM